MFALQSGSHPRLGAMDVCPLVGVRGVTEEELVILARRLGQILAATLDVPIFLYGAAATHEYRSTVPQIRSGQYESLADKVTINKNKSYERILLKEKKLLKSQIAL